MRSIKSAVILCLFALAAVAMFSSVEPTPSVAIDSSPFVVLPVDDVSSTCACEPCLCETCECADPPPANLTPVSTVRQQGEVCDPLTGECTDGTCTTLGEGVAMAVSSGSSNGCGGLLRKSDGSRRTPVRSVIRWLRRR